jgi:hypothetical protein
MATGDPEARRVIFGTYVVPTYSIEGEETSVRHTEFQTSPAGTLGGKGIATINKDQWGDGWTSFAHQGAYWEDCKDSEDVWELQGETWDGGLGLTNTPTDLTDKDDADLAFLYVKNTGTTYNALLALDETALAADPAGTSDGNYYIIIPPGGSVALRGDGTNVEPDEVFLKSEGSSGEETTIEFIIAIE